jgi:YHS domain-containing protein/thiol-disulfide isomerase/thioredoxin
MLYRRSRAHRGCSGVSIAILFLGWSMGSTPASEADSEGISWRTDYARALEEARTRNQLLWIHFTAPWCPNCTRMERDSFAHPAMRELARRSFVPVKLRSDVNEELALSFELSGLPATVIVAPSRQVISVHQGYLGPGELVNLLQDATRQQDLQSQRSAKETATKAGDSGDYDRKRNTTQPKTENELALSGFCPVSLVSDKRLVPGQAEYTVTHEGRLYRFASLLTFNLFSKDPQRYVPVNDGYCPVAQLDRGTRHCGDPKYGVLYEGRLFLCASDSDRKRFLQEPGRYGAVDVAENGFCPHCLAQNGLLVRGDPRYDLAREGRRYWFPDVSHRDAFLSATASKETTTRR